MNLLWQLSEPESRVAAAFLDPTEATADYIKRQLRDGEFPVRVPVNTGLLLLRAFQEASVEGAEPESPRHLGWMTTAQRVEVATEASTLLLQEFLPDQTL